MELSPGQVFDGKYEIVRAIGSGGMGRIYEAVQRSMNRRVAIKLLPSVSVSKIAELRLEREALALAQLNHPGVVSVFGSGRSEVGPYLVLEYVEGHTLSTELGEQKTLGVQRTVDIILQLCQAIAYTHEHGIIHRDLKPDNIIIVPGESGDKVKLIDLGLAKFLLPEPGKELQKLTETDFALGTVHYMSPEQCVASPKVDRRSDIYAIGIIMYECLTGKRAVDGINVMAVMYAHCNQNLQPLHAVLGEPIETGLQAIMDKATAKVAAARYQSMSEMTADLQLVQTGRGADVETKLGSVSKSKNRKSARMVVVAAVFLLAVGGFGLFFWPTLRAERKYDHSPTEVKPKSGLDYIVEGNSHMHRLNFAGALRCYETALHILEETRGRPVELLAAHLGVTAASDKLRLSDKAVENANASIALLQLYPQYNQKSSLFICESPVEFATTILAGAYLVLGDNQRAEVWSKKVIDMTKTGEKKHADAYRILAEAYINESRFEEAVAMTDVGLNGPPGQLYPWLHMNKAVALICIGDRCVLNGKSGRSYFAKAVPELETSIALFLRGIPVGGSGGLLRDRLESQLDSDGKLRERREGDTLYLQLEGNGNYSSVLNARLKLAYCYSKIGELDEARELLRGIVHDSVQAKNSDCLKHRSEAKVLLQELEGVPVHGTERKASSVSD